MTTKGGLSQRIDFVAPSAGAKPSQSSIRRKRQSHFEVANASQKPRCESVGRSRRLRVVSGRRDQSAKRAYHFSATLPTVCLLILFVLMMFIRPAMASPSKADVEALVRTGSIDQLKSYLAEPGVDINDRPVKDRSLLDFAAQFDRVDMATYLLDHGARLDAKKVNWPNVGITPLHMAASFGSVHVEQLLLDRGAQVDTKAARGTTPLMYAASAGQLDAARLLLERGAGVDWTIQPYDQNAMGMAIEGEHLEMARMLESHGEKVEGRFLGAAAQNGDVETVRFILAHDVDMESLNIGVRMAILGKPERVVERKQILSDVLAHGADIDNLMNDLPPIVLASTADMVEFLLQHGAGGKKRTADTVIVRQLACKQDNNDEELVRILVVLRKHGIQLRDDKEPGQPALECARQFGLTEAKRYLLAVESAK